MNTSFNGERLKKARIYRGLTVAELAERIGCQRQTLSMYEISKSQPTDKTTVVRLAQELDFPVKYFYEHPDVTTSGTVYFRSLLTTNKKYRSEQIVKMDYLAQIYSLLQDYVAFPEYEPIECIFRPKHIINHTSLGNQVGTPNVKMLHLILLHQLPGLHFAQAAKHLPKLC